MTVKKWSVYPEDLNINKRIYGISGFMRVRNEGEWLRLAIESHIPFLDEIVVVHNRCTDDSPQIAEDLKKKYPNQIKVIHYEPDVYPQGSKEAISLPIDSPHSLANYYNFALCQTTRKIALKVDGDQIAIPTLYEEMIKTIRSFNEQRYYYRFCGINLYLHNGEIKVQGVKNITAMDRGFFEINNTSHPWHDMKRDSGLEILKFGAIRIYNYPIPSYFHMKGMKRDKGVGNYDLADNPSSRYHSIFKKEWESSEPIGWEDFISSKKYADIIPHPKELGVVI